MQGAAFSIGFGPEIFGFNDRYGTRWKLSAIPLGGYVKFFGDENAASVPDHDAVGADEPRRSARSASSTNRCASGRLWWSAGPIANFILAIVIFAAIFVTVRQADTSAARRHRPAGQRRRRRRASSRATSSLSIDGETIDSFADMQRIVSISAGETLTSWSIAAASPSR